MGSCICGSGLSESYLVLVLNMSGFSRQSRFMRSMTPSGSVKMSTSRFNLVCGKTNEQAVRPNLERVPNPQPPKIIDARVTTPTLRRREFSQTRDSLALPPVPPTRDSSLYLPYGSYAEMGIHSRPSRYGSSTSSMTTRRRSITPVPSMTPYISQVSNTPSTSYSSSRRNSVSVNSSSSTFSRQRHYSTSAAYGTPASNRGIPFY